MKGRRYGVQILSILRAWITGKGERQQKNNRFEPIWNLEFGV
jgi:hypothetical protein